MAEPILAVDFGTTTTSAVLRLGDRTLMIREPGSGAASWPSAVYDPGVAGAAGSGPAGSLMVGTAAEHQKLAEPQAYRAEFKRELGQPQPVVLGGHRYALEDLVAAMLDRVRRQAVRLTGEPVERAVLTIPASYGDNDPRRGLMLRAGAAAGFAEVDLLVEPVAASWAPLAGSGWHAGDLVLVFDFGGGTFDTALVEIGATAHRVLRSSALAACGGADVDARIVEHLRVAAGGAPADGYHELALFDLARHLKHHLTDAEEATGFVAPGLPRYRLDRATFEKLAQPVVDDAVACCRGLLAACDVAPGRLAGVLLSGGASQMPLVARLVQQHLGATRWPQDPALAVVSGAARWAAGESSRAVAPWPPDELDRPLRWQVPGGEPATFVRWLVPRAGAYRSGDELAVVRLRDGTLRRLRAPDTPGRMVERHALPGQFVLTGDWLATARPRLTDRAELAHRLPGGDGGPMGFAPDGAVVAVAQERALWLWNVATGERVRQVSHDAPVTGLVFNGDGGTVAIGSERGTVLVWDRRSGERTHVLPAPPDAGAVLDLSFEPGDRYLLVLRDGSGLVSYDLATGRALPPPADVGPIRRFARSPGARMLAVLNGDSGVRLQPYDGEDGPARRLDDRPLRWLAFGPDGGQLAVVREDTSVAVWDVAAAARQWQSELPVSAPAAFSADGHYLAVAAGPAVTVHDTRRGTPLLAIDHDHDVAGSRSARTAGIWPPPGRRTTSASGRSSPGSTDDHRPEPRQAVRGRRRAAAAHPRPATAGGGPRPAAARAPRHAAEPVRAAVAGRGARGPGQAGAPARRRGGRRLRRRAVRRLRDGLHVAVRRADRTSTAQASRPPGGVRRTRAGGRRAGARARIGRRARRPGRRTQRAGEGRPGPRRRAGRPAAASAATVARRPGAGGAAARPAGRRAAAQRAGRARPDRPAGQGPAPSAQHRRRDLRPGRPDARTRAVRLPRRLGPGQPHRPHHEPAGAGLDRTRRDLGATAGTGARPDRLRPRAGPGPGR
ncbi:Hsp70 family protein [Phytohabitans suffuscus]|uniref:Hsp70 family protein n=1 Tax=Phytohabitans suffuscus TaxID=624315 RepID=UPI001565B905|nr:Hsp70 family protein [Phytohabitans suffuscus]